jgi:hypothetical protein
VVITMWLRRFSKGGGRRDKRKEKVKPKARIVGYEGCSRSDTARPYTRRTTRSLGMLGIGRRKRQGRVRFNVFTAAVNRGSLGEDRRSTIDNSY